MCGCGRKVYAIKNSTIKPKLHPSCQLREAYKNKNVKNNLSGHKKKPKSPRQKAMDRADKWFSRYIRVKYAKYGSGRWYCHCYTCGSIHSVVSIQNGHWRRRGFKTTRFHINNARPQCVKCNYHRSGEPEIFENNLIKEIGIEEVDKIRYLSLDVGEDNEIFYKEIANKYRVLTNNLLKEKHMQKWW